MSLLERVPVAGTPEAVAAICTLPVPPEKVVEGKGCAKLANIAEGRAYADPCNLGLRVLVKPAQDDASVARRTLAGRLISKNHGEYLVHVRPELDLYYLVDEHRRIWMASEYQPSGAANTGKYANPCLSVCVLNVDAAGHVFGVFDASKRDDGKKKSPFFAHPSGRPASSRCNPWLDTSDTAVPRFLPDGVCVKLKKKQQPASKSGRSGGPAAHGSIPVVPSATTPTTTLGRKSSSATTIKTKKKNNNKTAHMTNHVPKLPAALSANGTTAAAAASAPPRKKNNPDATPTPMDDKPSSLEQPPSNLQAEVNRLRTERKADILRLEKLEKAIAGTNVAVTDMGKQLERLENMIVTSTPVGKRPAAEEGSVAVKRPKSETAATAVPPAIDPKRKSDEEKRAKAEAEAKRKEAEAEAKRKEEARSKAREVRQKAADEANRAAEAAKIAAEKAAKAAAEAEASDDE